MTTTETRAAGDGTIAEITEDGDPADLIGRRVDRLNTASLRKVIEPDTDVAGALGPGQVFSSQLSVAADLDLGLTDEQKVKLSREEMASVVVAGIRFEAILMSGFAEQVAHADNIVDPRIVYMLHEIGEETRHSRLFLRLVEQLAPTAKSPADDGIANFLFRHVTRFVIHRPTALCVLVLAGEEIPDLIQKKLVEHPDTDPFLKSVNRYHRQEEARHLAYARMVLPELWEEASWVDRFTVRHLLPVVIRTMFDWLVHPGVFETVGLPGRATWRAVAKSRHQTDIRHQAIRPVLAALVTPGVIPAGQVSRGWRRLCGVDRFGQPVGN
ncbi:MAG TPA: diiron oxygenase [Acidimicrobiales bacterium]|nr:diiron oxygenase [Acidimicrobiales bacterium]